MQYATGKKKYLEKKEEQEIFIRKVATDFVSTIKKFDGVSSVIFTKDSSSWRKEKYGTYKANRHKDEDNMNWEIFYKLMDEFMEIISESGVIISSIKKAEGDDLMYLWSDYCSENEIASSIIITADADLTQVVNIKNDAYTIVYTNNSKNQKLVVPEGFMNWFQKQRSEVISSVFAIGKSEQVGNNGLSVITNCLGNIEVEEIDPNLVVLTKVLCGDKSDNIPSVYQWINKKGNVQKITNRYMQPTYDYLIKRYDKLDILEILGNKICRNNLRGKLEELTKAKIDSTEFDKKLEDNINLVYLHKSIIPTSIIDNFNEVAETIINNKTKTFDRYKLLKDTRFEKDIQVYSSVFDI